MASSCADADCQFAFLVESLKRARVASQSAAQYDQEPSDWDRGRNLLPLEYFSNEDLLRKSKVRRRMLPEPNQRVGLLHELRTEAQPALADRKVLPRYAGSYIRESIQLSDEHALMKPFHETFMGTKSPRWRRVDLATLPTVSGALGEMC